MDGNPLPNNFDFRYFWITWFALNNAKFMFVTIKSFTGVKDNERTSAYYRSKFKASLSAYARIKNLV